MASKTKREAPAEAKSKAVAKAKAIAPDVPARIGTTPETDLRGLPDIFGRLIEDHDRHRALLAMIEVTEGKSADREALFEELVYELKSHAAAEEQALWSTVLRNPETTEFARHAVAEHKDIDKMLDDLTARDMGKKKWMERFADLKHEYLHHIREEEQEQFVESEKILTEADRQHMRDVFERRKTEEKARAELKPKLKVEDIA
ncbi:MAG: hemerythrin HHE cation-binding protein [Novosphingobium sp. 17-62-19]|uniref:hemerythrin domain-containing protein n=1 Tax=Novosphingobium sp. 17-62-19 TaxID=1970406 RepID=UPI000BD2DCE5|nr:hemerythrin domain-containing protein [Novosphingobium sp. 17-62-19]OZA20591.1 MAG: hemerythrin HHE cation-binding protein [Novosphingobium sp. 17-62-19]HQS95787.1 hemerythrin domain-containing protein [Novosphingobium sp.]